ncbi:hypothetical protein DID88_004112 [Monilinia fructigena]|uniref:Uncharacterized protein n=1 Tax=Monilinia fructigena TaxID=38457 RepID=A0A395IRU0_9HELO|nr:hypothetical protein DID88_004112 [Monilinia fructigena]
MSGKVSSQGTCTKRSDSGSVKSLSRKPVPSSSKSDTSLSDSNSINNRKNKPKPFSLLGRSRSLRDDQSPAEPSPPKIITWTPDTHTHQHASSAASSVKTTAPARSDDDRNSREMSTPAKYSTTIGRSPT